AFSPTVHKLLAHSVESIKLNDGYGLGLLAEDALEGTHKELRRAGNHHARMTSSKSHLEDMFVRMWIISDPALRQFRKKKQLRKKTFKKDNEDLLVESFLIQ
ncbi:unnamed protein product, partial [Meganyctiphanes norvegica]